MKVNRRITKFFVVSNAVHFKHFERWARPWIPVQHVVNDGVTSAARKLDRAISSWA